MTPTHSLPAAGRTMRLTIAGGESVAIEPGGSITIGRDATCEIVLAGDASVAPQHCRFDAASPVIRVIDLSGSAGTFVNGQRVVESVLREGDEIRCGTTRLVLEMGGSASEPMGETVLLPGRQEVEEGDRTLIAPAGLEAATIDYRPAKPGRMPLGELGRFQLESILGQGGFGRVYRAYDPQLDRWIALKVPTLANDDGTRSLRFRAEARSAARLRHPNIVPTFDSGQIGEQVYIASQFIDGQPLSALARQAPIEVERAVAWTIAIARALGYAHRMGIVHRDVKPSNVMLDDRDEPQLMDFGLAKRVDDESEMTTEGSIVGTPAYMAPEQARGEASRIGPHSDQYAVGAVLYELLSGRPPFKGTVHAVLSQVVNEEPGSLRSLKPELHRDLEAICQKAMKKEPEQRYASCDELADDLERWQRGEPTRARPVTHAERLRRWVRRNPKLAGAMGVAVAALVIAAALGVTFAAYQSAAAGVLRTEQGKTLIALGQVTEEKNRAETLQKVAESSQRDAEKSQKEAEVSQKHAETNQKLAEDRALKLRATVARSSFQAGVIEFEQGHEAEGLRSLIRAAAMIEPESPLFNGYRRVLLDRCLRLGRQLTPPLRDTDTIGEVAFSSDGRTCATASYSFMARLWNTRTGEPIGEPLQHEGPVFAVAFQPSGNRVVTVSYDNTARVWEARSGKPIGLPLRHPSRVTRVAFDRSGERFATGCGDGGVRIWNAATLEAISNPLNHSSPINCIAFHPTANQLASGGDNSRVQLWDLETEQPIGQPMVHGNLVTSLAFHPDGSRLLTGANDNRLLLWDTKTQTETGQSMGHSASVTDVGFSNDGRYLLSGSYDLSARLWDADQQKTIGPQMLHQGYVLSVAFDRDGKRVATGSIDGTLKLWNGTNAEPIGLAMRHDAGTQNLTFSPDGLRLLSGGRDSTARIWGCAVSEPAATPVKRDETLIRATSSAGGERLLINSRDGYQLLTRNPESGQYQAEILRPTNVGRAAVFSPDGSRIATGGNNGEIHLFDGASRLFLRKMSQGDYMYCVAFSPDGKRLVSTGRNLVARVWDVETGAKVLEVEHPQLIRCAAFHPDGTRFATASHDRTARMWDARTGEPVGPVLTHNDHVHWVTFSSDGRLIATACADNTARFWDAQTGEPYGRPLAHLGDVTSIAFSPDNRRVVTSSGDGLCSVWDVATSARLGITQRHRRSILCAEFVNPEQVLTCSLDGRAHIWHARSLDPESLEEGPMFDAVRLWSGFDWDNEGNVRDLSHPELEALRRKLGPNDPLLKFQQRWE